MKLEEGGAVAPRVTTTTQTETADAGSAGPASARKSQTGKRLFDETTVPVTVKVEAAQIANDANLGALSDPSGTGFGAAVAVVVGLVRRAFR
jgi:hypothetical protein